MIEKFKEWLSVDNIIRALSFGIVLVNLIFGIGFIGITIAKYLGIQDQFIRIYLYCVGYFVMQWAVVGISYKVYKVLLNQPINKSKSTKNKTTD